MNNWSGKRVVVTGAAAGVGRGLAVEAGARGAHVMAVDKDDPQETVAQIEAGNGTASGFVCDITDLDQLTEVAAQIQQTYGTSHALFANAGYGAIGGIAETTPDQFAALISVNVVGTYNTLYTFADQLALAATAEAPSYVMITGSEVSLGTWAEGELLTAYAPSKHALLGLADSARRDLAPRHVAVSVLCPGWVMTESLQASLPTGSEVRAYFDTISQSPAQVAAIALDSIGDGRLIVATNTLSQDVIARRIDWVNQALNTAASPA